MEKVVKRYRIFCRLGSTRLYANREDFTFPRVRWSERDTEYPDHFSMKELRKILAFYSDQKLEYYSTYVTVETEDA